METQNSEIKPLFYSSNDVCTMLNVSRQFIYEAAVAGNFPKPVKVGRLNRYRVEEIDAYIQQLGNKGDK
ncbi:MAG: helix-turn-helix domain-containing protein [[Pasteurella] mairii]|uniref:Predicted transcriptional regulator n=1 Tax=[Pasteurella] mairii TaxID=757 RepID=A0A379B2S6_9PAST|nr:helix-turn-helix domain-containing protein [[Pasteurella] mairii]SUB32811.1 Predicted transcriptional regulator [[Pasteurella] mairii]